MKSVCVGRIYNLHIDATVVLARYVIVQNNKIGMVRVLK